MERTARARRSVPNGTRVPVDFRNPMKFRLKGIARNRSTREWVTKRERDGEFGFRSRVKGRRTAARAQSRIRVKQRESQTIRN